MLFSLRLLLPVLLALSIYSLDFFHFRVDGAVPPPPVVERLAAAPADAVLGAIADISLEVSLGIPPQDRPQAAHEIYEGRLHAPNFSATRLQLQGWPGDLFVGGPTFQLVMASLAVEDLLLRDAESSGRREHYALAKDRILQFADWEAAQHAPAAFLWNDHAVSARISVLLRFWRMLRSDPGATPAQRAALLALVSRSGGLLAKSSQFTVRTNHGVMQNIALLQLSAAFPDLPQSGAWRKLALDRLELQLGFYVSPEGVVLEHSSEYHLFGVQLLGYAIQLARLNGLEPSARLLLAHQRSQEFSKVLTRPDGTVPIIGNTASQVFSEEDHRRFMASGAASKDAVATTHAYPISGYAVWNQTGPVASQVAVAWAKHDRHGHKHADETSVHFWSRGIDWITATGYWPYGEKGYDEANGWRGANAPHLRGESAHSARRVELKFQGGGPAAKLVDVETRRESGAVLRRQVVQLGAERLLVVDTAADANQPVDTLWTLRPEHRLLVKSPTHFVGQPAAGGQVLHMNFAFGGAGGAASASTGGSFSPFTGWVVVGRRTVAAPAVTVERAAGAHMTAALFSVGGQDQTPALTLDEHVSAEQWSASLQDPQGALRVRRHGAVLEVTGPGAAAAVVDLAAPASVQVPQQALRAAMTEALRRYPAWRELKSFHTRLYALIAALWAVGEAAAMTPVGRRIRARWLVTASYGLGWLALAWWVHARYLESADHLLALWMGS
jgi:hypothetical protein